MKAPALLLLAVFVLPADVAQAGSSDRSITRGVRSTSGPSSRSTHLDRSLRSTGFWDSAAEQGNASKGVGMQMSESTWEEYQSGGHCLYGTNGELLHAPPGRECASGPPVRRAPRRDARQPRLRYGSDACIAGQCRNGFGTYAWSDGSRYTGEFRAKKPDGRGTLVYSDGGIYTGEWQRGFRTGYGTAAFADGRSQTGYWERGRFLGRSPLQPGPASAAQRSVRWPSLSRPARRVGGGAKDAAVIVGLERYAHVPRIQRAADNAAAWFQYFVRTRGVAVENVALLLDADATREEIEVAAEQAASRARRGGTLWFVFIGHGAPSDSPRDGLLVGFDAQQKPRSLLARSVSQSALLKTLERSEASHIRLLIDACFSGRSAGGEPLVAGLQPLVVTSGAPSDDPRTTVFTAARGDEFAGPLPGAARPAFSYLALGGLRGWADADRDERITAAELHRYVSRAMQAVVRDRRQRPTLSGREDVRLARSARERGPDLAALVLDAARRD